MSQKKFYVIYQITNNLNGKIYIGKHKTNNLDDDYMGSGKYLHKAFKKYGLENFTKTILFYLQNEDEMNLLEKMVVTKEFCDRDDTYNLNVGGDGGWDYVNVTVDRQYRSKCIRDAMARISPDIRRQQLDKQHKALALHWKEAGHNWIGRKHSEQTKEKMRKPHPSACGKGNSQYGTRWICNDLTGETKKILKSDPIPDGWRKGRIYKNI